MNIFEAIGDLFLDFDGTWDKFINGNANEVAKEQQEKQLYHDTMQSELARSAEASNTDAVNRNNYNINKETNESNLKIARETNSLNKQISDSVNQTNLDIANQNLAFQRENLDYQKALQQQLFEREDTSYQRTALDMANAGLNPLTMQGTNGSGQVVSTTPLNNNFQAQGYTAEGAVMNPYENKKDEGASIRPKFERFQALANGFQSVIGTLTGVTDSMSNLMSGFAQRDMLKTQVDSSKIDNFIKMQNQGYHDTEFNNGKYQFSVPTYNGQTVSPSNFNGKLDNPDDWYNPRYKYSLTSIPLYRQMSNDAQYNLFNNSTEWERNMTAFEKSLDTGRFNEITNKVGDAANDLLKQFLKALNK